jgi:recombinational DNA repair protein (RecF pathway)
MPQTASWNFAPADAKRLPELLRSFECADVIAPVDDVAFSKKAGELICRNKAARHKAEPVTPTAGKYRLRALQCFETAAQSRDPYAKDMLTEVAREFLQAAREVEETGSH